ncbi:L,D-transpeptidase [Ktedonospora formicarum]|uniref:Uncharacterized protein n=1 Tax=Ktedonospora formicarum TaxID=2778364 RepID=A0A8J3HYG5_9CHLR|nr:L,D-transpeptidase [Ktedonospora formicarum]GHO44281.1 hypothetical protein KSX_24440 [Ktedonospora formicarum]
MQHSRLDDLTPEERDPRNQEIVDFLSQTYTSASHDEQPSAQRLLRMRQRLASTLEAEGNQTRPVMRTIQGGGGIYSGTNKRRTSRQRLTLLAIAAVLVLIVGSSVVVFQGMSKRATNGNTANQSQATATQTIVVRSPKEQARFNIDKLKQEANTWGESHLYHNSGDGKSYKPDIAYLEQGALKELEDQFKSAKTSKNYQKIANQAEEALLLLHAFEHEAGDQTPYNQAHKVDTDLLHHYQLNQGTVIVISTAQQSLRLYQDGKFSKGFQVTAGSTTLPLAIGKQNILARNQHIILKSPFPQNDSHWFPDVLVNNMIQFHVGGYMIFDAAWRDHFGPGSQYPQGSEATKHPSGVGMNPDDMQWLYEHTNSQTQVLVY